MGKYSALLAVDALINYALGILCLLYAFVAKPLGVPLAESSFYPNILGAVFFGIGIALTIECFKKHGKCTGLGIGGAVAINLSGGIVLIFWLIFGNLNIPFRGYVFLWMLAFILIFISSIELAVHIKKLNRS